MYSWDECKACQKKRGTNWVETLFACAPVWVDRHIRNGDFRINRSYGGLLSRFGLDGHSPLAVLLPAILLYFVVFGPTDVWGLKGFAILFASLVGLGGTMFAAKRLGQETLPFLQVVWISLVCGWVYWLGGPDAIEADGGLYQHVLLVVIPWLMIGGLALSRWISRRVVNGVPEDYKLGFRNALEEVDLFELPEYPQTSLGDILRTLINVPVRYPLLLLIVPGFVAIMLPHVFPLGVWAGSALALSWILLSFAGIHRRFNDLLLLAERTLFVGGAWLVSVLVIALAIARIAEVSYVATVLDSSASTVLAALLLATYAFFWFYQYWINRFFCEDILELIDDGDSERRELGRLRFRVDGKRCSIEIHGGARFVAVGESSTGGVKYQFHERAELFRRLARGDQDVVSDIGNRIRFYFSTANLLLILIIYGFIQFQKDRPQEPIAEFSQSAIGVESVGRLLQQPGLNHAVAIAASGGGTRAAMYTAGVMRGLWELTNEQGDSAQIVLASGVSGGGASLAYFAGHRGELLDGDAAAWNRYGDTVAQPFIQDVLDGFAEWRLAGGTRMGQLLSESFDRRFENSPETFGEVTEFGLMLNSALAGSLSLHDSARWDKDPCWVESRDDCKDRQFRNCAQKRKDDCSTSVVAGGRFTYTNLRLGPNFPNLAETDAVEYEMNYAVSQDPSMKLTQAAALNANFPPVFSNAPVDDPKHLRRYWVTDGGAVENRGVLSLLFAIREALNQMPDEPQVKLPQLHLVVAEASGGSTRFSQNRGIGSVFSAPGKIANQLMTELVADIRTRYSNLGASAASVHVYYLAMPPVLRIDGGLGTHWMLPPEVAVTEDLMVSGEAVKRAIYSLYRSDDDGETPWFTPSEPTPKVQDQIKGVLKRIGEEAETPRHNQEWSRLRMNLE